MEIEIREVKKEDEEQVKIMYDEYMNSKPIPRIDRFEGIRDFEKLNKMSFNEWIEDLEKNKDEKQLPKEYSAHTLYLAINENKKIALYLKNTAKSQLNLIYDEVKIKFDDFIIVLIGEENGKYPVIVGVGAKLLNDYNAKDIIKNVTNILGGKGGGRNDFAQGNIVDPSKISSIKF